MSTLTTSCPHCLSENPAFGAQRCISCQLNMMSDQEFALLQQKIKPDLIRLQALSQSTAPTLSQIQPLLSSLTHYEESFPFLKEELRTTRQSLEPRLRAEYEKRKRLVIHLTILLVLLIAPLLASWWQAPLYLTGLFMLPVLGWFAIGIWPLVRKRG